MSSLSAAVTDPPPIEQNQAATASNIEGEVFQSHVSEQEGSVNLNNTAAVLDLPAQQVAVPPNPKLQVCDTQLHTIHNAISTIRLAGDDYWNLKPTPTAEFFVSDRPSKHTSQRNEAFSYALDRQEDKARKLREVHTVMIPSLVKEQEQLRKALKPLKAGVGGLSAGLEDFKAMEKLVDAKTLLRNKGM